MVAPRIVWIVGLFSVACVEVDSAGEGTADTGRARVGDDVADAPPTTWHSLVDAACDGMHWGDWVEVTAAKPGADAPSLHAEAATTQLVLPAAADGGFAGDVLYRSVGAGTVTWFVSEVEGLALHGPAGEPVVSRHTAIDRPGCALVDAAYTARVGEGTYVLTLRSDTIRVFVAPIEHGVAPPAE